MKIYVATSFACKADFHRVRNILESNGHIVIHDWTTDNPEGKSEAELKEYLLACAAACALGVMESEVFVLIARPNMAGAFVELGIALTMSIPVIVIDAFKEGNQSNIFYHMPINMMFQHLKDEADLVKVVGNERPKNPYDDIGIIPGTIPGDN